MEEIQETPTPTPRKSALHYVIGAGIVILLAAAAFMAVRYFVQPKNAAFNESGEPSLSMQQGSGGEAKMFKLNLKPAKELPTTEPDVRGLFVERKDNSVFVGTGNATVMVKSKNGEQPKIDSNFSGPKVDVVISANTVVYKDTTKLDEENPGAEVQQTVEPSSIDEITQQSSITVWGRKAGDRVIADVVVFSTPFMIKGPGAGKP